MRWRLRHKREHGPRAAPPSPGSGLDPAARGARTARPREEASPLSPFERAVARFNASEGGRTVAGLVRTLGLPSVSVGASAGTPGEVRITVAWELSWYQWGVDLDEASRPVFQLGKGSEIDQLDSAARQWNASAVEGGRIVLVAPTAKVARAWAPARR